MSGTMGLIFLNSNFLKKFTTPSILGIFFCYLFISRKISQFGGGKNFHKIFVRLKKKDLN